METVHLDIFIFIIITAAFLGCVFTGDTALFAGTNVEGRCEGEVDVLLAVDTDHEGWAVNNTLADAENIVLYLLACAVLFCGKDLGWERSYKKKGQNSEKEGKIVRKGSRKHY